jgi:hypothetical protein
VPVFPNGAVLPKGNTYDSGNQSKTSSREVSALTGP